MTKWSTRLTEARKGKGWSVAELARRADVPKDRLYKYEKGKAVAPRGDTLERLAHALGMTPLKLEHGVDLQEQGTQQPLHIGLRTIPIIPLSDLSSLSADGDISPLIRAGGYPTMSIPDVGPRAMALRLDDGSMADKFPEGLLIVCDPDAPPVPGKYVVAVSHKLGRAVFRRYKLLDVGSGKAELLAENAHFPKLTMASKKDGFIVGRVVGRFERL